MCIRDRRELGIGMSRPHVLDLLDLPAPTRDDLDRDRPRGSADLAHEPRDHPEGFHDEVLSDHIPPTRKTNQQVSAPPTHPGAEDGTSQGGLPRTPSEPPSPTLRDPRAGSP